MGGSHGYGAVGSFTTDDNAASPLLLAVDAGATPGTDVTFDVVLSWEGPDETDTSGIFTVGTPEPDQWVSLGGGTSGINGVPALSVTGPLTVGSQVDVDLVDAAPSALMLAWLSTTSVPLPAVGGTIHANPFTAQFLRVSDVGGDFAQSTTWPSGVPSGTDLYLQFLVQDFSVIHDLTLSNAVTSTTP